MSDYFAGVVYLSKFMSNYVVIVSYCRGRILNKLWQNINFVMEVKAKY